MISEIFFVGSFPVVIGVSFWVRWRYYTKVPPVSRSSRATRTPQEVRDEAARIRALSASPLASPVPTPPALVQSDEEVQPPREEQGNGNIILFPGTRTMLGKPVSSEDVVAAQRKQR